MKTYLYEKIYKWHRLRQNLYRLSKIIIGWGIFYIGWGIFFRWWGIISWRRIYKKKNQQKTLILKCWGWFFSQRNWQMINHNHQSNQIQKLSCCSERLNPLSLWILWVQLVQKRCFQKAYNKCTCQEVSHMPIVSNTVKRHFYWRGAYEIGNSQSSAGNKDNFSKCEECKLTAYFIVNLSTQTFAQQQQSM